jgi:hypothetical protein
MVVTLRFYDTLPRFFLERADHHLFVSSYSYMRVEYKFENNLKDGKKKAGNIVLVYQFGFSGRGMVGQGVSSMKL